MQSGAHASSLDTSEAARRRHRFALLFALCTVLTILGTTLYPFAFTTEGYETRVQACLTQRLTFATGLADDIFANVFLFLPFGFALAHLTTRRGLRFAKAIILVVLAGTVLSTFVEFLQLYLPFRWTSFIDIYSNAGGTALGFLLHALLGKRISRHLGEAVAQPNNRKAIRWLTAAYLAYFGCALLLTVSLLFSLRIFDWDTDFPLTLGNVHSGDRPWRGDIERLTFAKYGIGEPLITKSLREKQLDVAENQFLLCDYAPGKDSAADQLNKLPPLMTRRKPGAPDEKRFILSANQWLETKGPVGFLSNALMATGEFTVFTRIRAASTTQAGPARIVSIDKNPYEVNFALTQVGDQLGIRFRSMTSGIAAYAPGFFIPGVFVDTLTHTVLVTNDRLMLRVFIDSTEHKYSLILGPGLALFNRFMPTHKLLDISSPLSTLNEILFAACVFLPLAYFLTFIALGLRRKPRQLLLVTICGIAGPLLAFRELFVFITLTDMPREYFSMTIVMMLLGFAGMWTLQVWKQRTGPGVFASLIMPAPSSLHQQSK